MRRFAGLGLPLGLLLLCSGLFSLVVVVDGAAEAAIKLLIGGVLLAVWAIGGRSRDRVNVARGPGSVRQMAVVSTLSLVLVGVNVLAHRRPVVLDVTRLQRHRLNSVTLGALNRLDTGVTLLVLAETPTEAIEELAARYTAISKYFSYQWQDTRRAPAVAKQFGIESGTSAALLLSSKTDGTVAQRLNLKALSNPLTAEAELTQALATRAKAATKKLYLLQGHGELAYVSPQAGEPEPSGKTLRALLTLLREEGYLTAPLTLTETLDVPSDAAALIMAGSRSRLTEAERLALQQYLEAGGRILYFGDFDAEPNFDETLALYGVQVDNGLVADTTVNAGQPYYVVSSTFSDHAIVKPLHDTRLVLLQTRSLTILRSNTLDNVKVAPLYFSTGGAFVETDATATPRLSNGEKSGQLVLAAASTRSTTQTGTATSAEARLVTVGDADILADGLGYEPNRRFVLSAIAWCVGNSAAPVSFQSLSDLSTLDIDQRNFGRMRLLTLDVVPMAILAVGMLFIRSRRNLSA
jgi:ABC-type uncharacterized transport system